MIHDIRSTQQTYLQENFNPICTRINEFKAKNQAFILKDLLTEIQDREMYTTYYITLTKGILLSLINSGYVEIIGTYNGYKNFVYMPKKEIKLPITTNQ